VVLSQTESKRPRFFYGYVVALAAFFTTLVMSWSLASYGVFFKPLATEFGWTRAMTAGALSLSLFVFGLLSMVTGRLTDRFGPRLVATVCGSILSLGYLLMSRINDGWQLYLFYGVIIAVGQSGGFVPMMSTVARWFVKKRGLMNGIVVAGIGVGIVIMPPVATHLIATYGWRTSYGIIGIITLVLLIGAAQFLKRDPNQIGHLPDGDSDAKPESTVPVTKGYTLGEALHTRQFWMLCATYFCYGFFVQPIIVHIVPHATDLGISTMTAASILSVIGGLSIAGRIGIGSGGDRIGHKPALVIAFLIAVIAMVLLLVAREVWMFYLFAVIFGFAYGGLIAIESPMTAQLFGLRAHGAILGVVHFHATIGNAIGLPFAGKLFDLNGNYQLAFLVFVGLSGVGLILVSLLRPIKK